MLAQDWLIINVIGAHSLLTSFHVATVCLLSRLGRAATLLLLLLRVENCPSWKLALALHYGLLDQMLICYFLSCSGMSRRSRHLVMSGSQVQHGSLVIISLISCKSLLFACHWCLAFSIDYNLRLAALVCDLLKIIHSFSLETSALRCWWSKHLA